MDDTVARGGEESNQELYHPPFMGTGMHPRAVEFRKSVEEEYGFTPDIHELAEGTKTAADAADAIGVELDQIAKSVVMAADDALLLALASGSHRVSEGKLADELDVTESAVRTASSEEIRDTLGWSIGGVPPFCHESAVQTFCDARLTEFDTVWAGGGTPMAIFPISPEELLQYTDASIVDVFE